jgi:hypothetical protein
VPPLPARDLADAPLARLFDEPGCPLCRRVRDVTARYIDAVLYESVNDVRFRGELDEGRGFCRAHVHEVLRSNRERVGGTLSASILLGAMLRVRRRELDAAVAAGGRGRAKRLEAAARPASCPVCGQGQIAASNAVESFVRLSADPAWSAALSRAPFCLDHLVRLLRAPGASGALDAVGQRQLERLAELQARVDAFAHHSAEDRRHLLTDEERASADDVAHALGGG